MKNKMIKKSVSLSIVLLLIAIYASATVESGSLQKNVVTGSINETSMNNKMRAAKLDGIAPTLSNTIEPHRYSFLPAIENYFYGYVVNPPPMGPINLSSWELLGPGIDPNYIAGADIDDYGKWYGIANSGDLYLIGFNGTMTFIGTSLPMNGLCFDATTQTWYGSGDHNIYTVDITTGQTTLVGQDGISTTIIGLACDNEGNIYGYDVVWSGTSTLYLLSKTNGSATAIGSMGIGFLYAQDPAYDRNHNILYIAGYTQFGTSALYTCDVTTGVVTLIGLFPGNTEIDGFAITWTVTNQPPESPEIDGPTNGIVNATYTFSIGPLTDPDGDSVFCRLDWGDGTVTGWLGPYASGQTISASHSWARPGIYEIRAMLRDTYGAESGWSEPHVITIVDNEPPNKPIITGPMVGKVGVAYNFTISTTDPEGDEFFYFLDWGDGTTTDWLGPYDSGEIVTVSHAWNTIGAFSIQVKAKDPYGEESNSDPFDIQIVKLKKSVLLGVFDELDETEDLFVMYTYVMIIVPSDSIMYLVTPIVIAKEYSLGFIFSSFCAGIFDAAILGENAPSSFSHHS